MSTTGDRCRRVADRPPQHTGLRQFRRLLRRIRIRQYKHIFFLLCGNRVTVRYRSFNQLPLWNLRPNRSTYIPQLFS